MWIENWKNPSGEVARRLAGYSPGDLVTCSVVRAELLHGAKKYGNAARRTSMVAGALSVLQSLAFDDAAADHFAAIKHELEQRGT